ncbi:N5-carboxyaminoimidazole ribonucleotide synthase [Magnetospirillum gryphiswaldense MSR-1]|uniref:N5-carboxyaminoimidazole ribonucleotide synthase n=2 Tax=Magnetospirillum gryphiswaldense TaxID=55518 RepID=A4TZ62_9PROT|nr:N5-carboxyaminoimidazole ribonucleotide synthase [Magnetospirillum gryphiswaldense MSR-1]AVM77177.1 N5-carboxyaminoimidazole ribonucleotide synthase [Magnetospirillum gryphiswaldense]CAM75919.1 Phosphoribosylaminoimidazole carboxylase ATPase subunit (AIR carboxylase) [Magnetospirillum gryphiswaldense MSR-1]
MPTTRIWSSEIMNTPLPPGGTIGIIGGGQLGRMAALAAARLGYRVHVFTPEVDSPTEQVAATATIAAYDDMKALEAFARAVDVVTFEFENIPAASVRLLTSLVPVRPSWKVLEVAQDRISEKRFFNGIGIATAPWAEINSAADLKAGVERIGRPAVLKTTRLGYDGKGQVKITAKTDLDQAWASMDGATAVLEGFIDFAGEVSVIVARGLDGGCATFDPAWNVHTNHILDTTTIPAPISQPLAERAIQVALKAAEALDLVGLLAVEMFVTKAGDVLVNEMAPRPHNSGHWTMDACVTDQFEQFIRAVCGLPLGSPDRHSDAVMTNLIGSDVDKWLDFLKEPGAKLHLYGKAEARSGRKMGHVTRIRPRQD